MLFLCKLLDLCGCQTSEVWVLNCVTVNTVAYAFLMKPKPRFYQMKPRFFGQNLPKPTANKNIRTVTALMAGCFY